MSGYLCEALSCITLGLKPNETVISQIRYKQDVEGGICLPIREKNKCHAYPRVCLEQRIGKGLVLGKSSNFHSDYSSFRDHRD